MKSDPWVQMGPSVAQLDLLELRKMKMPEWLEQQLIRIEKGLTGTFFLLVKQCMPVFERLKYFYLLGGLTEGDNPQGSTILAVPTEDEMAKLAISVTGGDAGENRESLVRESNSKFLICSIS